VTLVLFLGPLYGRYLSRNLPFMARWTFNKQVKVIFNWVGIRNYIVVRTSLTILSESSNLTCAHTGTHIGRSGLAFMFNQRLPPCGCLEYPHGLLHASVIRIWYAFFIPER
jgi:hypothetical protein